MHIYSDHGSKQKKPPGGVSDLLAKANRVLAEDKSGSVGGLASPFSSSSSSSKKRSNKAEKTYHFFKDATTGRRITHTEYRPRTSAGNTQELEDEEIPDYDITAENVAGQSHSGLLPSSRDSHFLED